MGRKQVKKSAMKKTSKRPLREGEIPNLKSSSALVFVGGLITAYTIFPDSPLALAVYTLVVGGALVWYNISHDKKLKDK